MGRKGRYLCNGAVELDELGDDLVSLADQYTTSNTEISVPPGSVHATSVRRNTELGEAGLVWYLAHWLEARSDCVDVASNDCSSVARLVLLSNNERKYAGAIALNPVLAAWLEFPFVTLRELLESVRLEL